MPKRADEVYIKLKNKQTSFNDWTQGKNVVADRVEVMRRSDIVSEALNSGQLIEATEAEYDASVAKRNPKGKAQAPVVEAIAAEATDTEEVPTKKEVAKKPARKTIDEPED
jgi:ABC-type microcin C transport system duplicated ATPase subunit YejF